MTRRSLAVARKEFRELKRDPITLWIALFVPLVLLFVFGYAIRLDVSNVPLAVLDHDRTPESRAFIEAILNTGDFVVHSRPATQEDVVDLMDAGKVRVSLRIPEGFGAALRAGGTARAQTLIDGSYSATALILRSEIEAVTLAFTLERIRGGVGRGAVPGLVTPEPRVWYNAGLSSEVFVVSGLFGVILMAFPPLLTVLAVVREKETGSVQQLYVSPLRPWEFVAGKMMAYFSIAVLEMATIVAAGVWWFDVPFRGSVPLLVAASLLFALCTVGIGLLVSTVTRSQVVAMLIALIITVMPSFLFSGFMFPISSMSTGVQWYTRIFPAQYFVELSRGLFLKGTGWTALAPELAILIGYTVVVFGAAAVRFRKKLA